MEVNYRTLAIYLAVSFILTVIAMIFITGVFHRKILPLLKGRKIMVEKLPYEKIAVKIDSLQNVIKDLRRKLKSYEAERYKDLQVMREVYKKEIKSVENAYYAMKRERDSLKVLYDTLLKEISGYKKALDSLSFLVDSLSVEVTSHRREEEVEEIRALRSEIRNLLEAGSEKLAKALSEMQPEEAARIMEKMSLDDALKLLFKMRERNAGRILAQMSPEKACSLAVKFLRLGEK